MPSTLLADVFRILLGGWRVAVEGDRQGLETAVRPQFVEDVLNVITNRGRTDTEAIGDGSRGFTGTHVP